VDSIRELCQGPVDPDILASDQDGEIPGAHLGNQVELRAAQGNLGIGVIHQGRQASQAQLPCRLDGLLEVAAELPLGAGGADLVALEADVRIGVEAGLDCGSPGRIDLGAGLLNARIPGQGHLLQLGQRQWLSVRSRDRLHLLAQGGEGRCQCPDLFFAFLRVLLELRNGNLGTGQLGGDAQPFPGRRRRRRGRRGTRGNGLNHLVRPDIDTRRRAPDVITGHLVVGREDTSARG